MDWLGLKLPGSKLEFAAGFESSCSLSAFALTGGSESILGVSSEDEDPCSNDVGLALICLRSSIGSEESFSIGIALFLDASSISECSTSVAPAAAWVFDFWVCRIDW